ncbi:MAG: hypothetical protein MK020_07515, partial [Dehalococcoidia bacterium]|nr:hypothetical protein [Dehalococcoidia bacterium]
MQESGLTFCANIRDYSYTVVRRCNGGVCICCSTRSIETADCVDTANDSTALNVYKKGFTRT